MKVLREVKEECGDTALSSDEEGECPWALGVAEVLELYQQLVIWLEPVIAVYLPSKEVIPVVSGGGGDSGTQSSLSWSTKTLLLGGV